MIRVNTGTRTPHLFSAVVACAFIASLLVVGRMFAIHLENRTLRATACEPFPLKNQGLAFQRAGLRSRDILPVYGSSELIEPIPETASRFFRAAPSGFQVSAIGKQGTTSLIILQKLAALGADVRGRKVAISLSPSWFFVPVINPHSYKGNFSLQAASEMVFGGALDFDLKRDIAARILQFPRTPAATPLLKLALARLASGGWLDRIVFRGLWPMGKAQNIVLDLQDHFESVFFILRQANPAPPLARKTLAWPELIAEATNEAAVSGKERGPPDMDDRQLVPDNDATFLQRMAQAREWIDLELLLRTLTQIHARPLLISMPMPGAFYQQCGLSQPARQAYYDKVRALAQRYGCPLTDFADHDADSDFLLAPHYHLSAKGWMFYNQVLDDFFHERGLPDANGRPASRL